MSDIGLLGIFDISDVVALSLSYQLILDDPRDEEIIYEKPVEGMKGVIIFAIVISSVVGAGLIFITIFFIVRKLK